MTNAKHKRDDPAQSRLFIKAAREIKADEDRSIADDLLKQLAKMAPEPRKAKKPKRSKK